jgi:hypothetical protein
MMVHIYVDLRVVPEEKHFESMRFCANRLTDNKESVEVVQHSEKVPKTLIAKFSVPKARQMDVVDKITQTFADFVEDSMDFGADFPRSAAEERKAKKASERAKARRKAQRAEKNAQAQVFFGADADPHAAGIVSTGKRDNLSKKQRDFLAAKEKVERRQRELAETTNKFERLLAQHTELVMPYLDRVTERQKQLIEVCSAYHADAGNGKPPPKTIRETLAKCMLELFLNLSDRDVPLDQRLTDLHRSLLDTYCTPELPKQAPDVSDAGEEANADHSDDNPSNEIMFELQKAFLSERLFFETGVRFDLSGLRSDMSHDEVMAHIAELLDNHPENPRNRKKTKRELDKEAKAKLAEEARAKNINSVYRQLARLFHPDLEQDPERKCQKERLMKELTAAHEAGDLHTILRLELRWLQNNEGDISKLSDEKLEAYTVALIEQSEDIQDEIYALTQKPRFAPLRLGPPDTRRGYSVLLSELKEEGHQVQAWADELEYDAEDLESLLALPPGKEKNKELRIFLRNLLCELAEEADAFRYGYIY